MVLFTYNVGRTRPTDDGELSKLYRQLVVSRVTENQETINLGTIRGRVKLNRVLVSRGWGEVKVEDFELAYSGSVVAGVAVRVPDKGIRMGGRGNRSGNRFLAENLHLIRCLLVDHHLHAVVYLDLGLRGAGYLGCHYFRCLRGQGD